MMNVSIDSGFETTTTGTHNRGQRLPRAFLLVSVLLLSLAGALRIYHLSQRSLWLDEAIAANISRGTLPETVVLTRAFHSAPILDPLILWSVEKISAGSLAVRMPSLIASMLAVLLMLCFARIPGIGWQTAVLSALMLTVSAAQIRYAQEVREYSLSVLYAGVLLYCFLLYTAHREERGARMFLYLALFGAPFVQYGLVLFSGGVLTTLLLLALVDGESRRRLSQLVVASGALGLGGLFSFLLTLRYQLGDASPYLDEYYYSRGSGLLRFVGSNTHHLVTFLLPGLAAASIAVVAAVLHLGSSVRARKARPLTILAFTSVGVVLVFALLHLYPFGGIRQCLFLAPVLCLFASACLMEIANRFAGNTKLAIITAIVCIVVISAIFQLRSLKPYAEVEDIQHVLIELQTHIEPGDRVYVYPGAVPAVDFYLKNRDPRFTYGDFHQQAPEEYVPEMLLGLGTGSSRLWIVFSHIYRDEDRKILKDLSPEWNVKSELSVKGSSLYLATRRVAAVATIKSDDSVTDASLGGSASTDHSHDTFWEWSIRNCSRPICRAPELKFRSFESQR
jgi:hypothetical protein